MKLISQLIKESKEMTPNAFVILKPEFLNYEDEWKSRLSGDWNILNYKKLQMTHSQACELYKMHKDKDFYNDLCDYMSSGECVCAGCYKDCEDPIKDMGAFKDAIRKDWGKDDMKNAMHSSDSLDNVNREYKIIFG